MLQVQCIAIVLESGTAGDVASRIAAVARPEIACGVALVNARCAFACALKNASSHVSLFSVATDPSQKGATCMPPSRAASAHAALAIMADGRKYHARLRENRRGILRCALCRDLVCARSTQYRLQRATAMVRSGRQRLPEGDRHQSRDDAKICGRSDGAD